MLEHGQDVFQRDIGLEVVAGGEDVATAFAHRRELMLRDLKGHVQDGVESR
jgi:hypothetical protein